MNNIQGAIQKATYLYRNKEITQEGLFRSKIIFYKQIDPENDPEIEAIIDACQTIIYCDRPIHPDEKLLIATVEKLIENEISGEGEKISDYVHLDINKSEWKVVLKKITDLKKTMAKLMSMSDMGK